MAVILIIDDEQPMRRMLIRLLRPLGHELHEAAHGNEGLEIFRQVHPDLVIADLVMPDPEAAVDLHVGVDDRFERAAAHEARPPLPPALHLKIQVKFRCPSGCRNAHSTEPAGATATTTG